MAVVELANEDKAAILLFTLSPETTEYVISSLGPQRGARVRRLMEIYAVAPDLEELLAGVTQEFDEVLQQAIEKANEPPPPPPPPAEAPVEPSPEEAAAAAPETQPAEAVPVVTPPAATVVVEESAEPSEDEYERSKKKMWEAVEDNIADPLGELRQLEVDRLVSALQREHPKAVAIVLLCLSEDKTAEVLRRLPTETRRNAFGLMANGLPKNAGLVESVLRAIVRACKGTGQSSSAGPEATSDEAKFKVMADVLNMLERSERMEMLAALQAQDAETAAMIEDLLYSFEDLLLIEDRSLQTILSEVGPKELATALMKAPETIIERVKANMSERVRAMLEEEMQFLGAVPSDQVQKARRKVTDCIRNHDKDGTLVWRD